MGGSLTTPSPRQQGHELSLLPPPLVTAILSGNQADFVAPGQHSVEQLHPRSLHSQHGLDSFLPSLPCQVGVDLRHGVEAVQQIARTHGGLDRPNQPGKGPQHPILSSGGRTPCPALGRGRPEDGPDCCRKDSPRRRVGKDGLVEDTTKQHPPLGEAEGPSEACPVHFDRSLTCRGGTIFTFRCGDTHAQGRVQPGDVQLDLLT
mmetsp:Transcript_38941/g.117124  ORF Transcript_38941/g.117124 Transcript_38941/m.117124 type:complete len:204 (+) Transcript_38941:534-1145(+)